MIIATSGEGNSINYNRIISSTSSNSVVAADSKTFKDITLLLNNRLRGLFIIDKDNLVALILEGAKTYVATLNLANPSITYKPSLPIINNMLTCVFVSSSVYYTPSYDGNFYKDYTNSVFLNSFLQGIVYSSDMSSSSCYTM